MLLFPKYDCSITSNSLAEAKNEKIDAKILVISFTIRRAIPEKVKSWNKISENMEEFGPSQEPFQ